MRRREFITFLGGAATTPILWPLPLSAQLPAMPVMGFVSFAQRQATLEASWYQAFHDGLRNHGWVPGRNLLIEYLFADDNPDRLALWCRTSSA